MGTASLISNTPENSLGVYYETDQFSHIGGTYFINYMRGRNDPCDNAKVFPLKNSVYDFNITLNDNTANYYINIAYSITGSF